MSFRGEHENSQPMSITEFPWLYKDNVQIREKYPYPTEKSGKWMLYYDVDKIDAAWTEAKRLYESDELAGISAMKVSTNYNNPRASNAAASKIVIFYCGPFEDEEPIMAYGRNLIQKMRYERQVSSGSLPPFIYYKPDFMTDLGTAATGQKKNHLYRLRYE